MRVLELQKKIIYGPVHSRRLGRSLGINIMPVNLKMCSMNCIYCQYGWTEIHCHDGREYREYLPKSSQVIKAITHVMEQQNNFDYLTFCGNGEPTLNPDFPRFVETAQKLKQKVRPEVKIAVLSNSTTCFQHETKKALEHLDLPIMKLDVGNENAFNRLNLGKPPVSFMKIIDGLRQLKNKVIQSMFVEGKFSNSTDWQVGSWMEKIAEIKPLWVQIYSLDRRTASRKLQKVSRLRLEEIAEKTEKKTGIKIEVY